MAKKHDLISKEVIEHHCSPNVMYVFRIVYCDKGEYVDIRKWCRYGGDGEMKPTRQGIFVNRPFFEHTLLPEINKLFPRQ